MTKSDVYNATLRKLGVLGSGETAETADTALATEAFTQVCADLGITSNYVLDGTGLHLATLCALELTGDFQVPNDKLQALLIASEKAKRAVLRLHGEEYDTDNVTEAEYF